jgi:hypothetical protein
MKLWEFKALLSAHVKTICVAIEGESGISSIDPLGGISAALQNYDISEISTYDGLIRLTLKKGAGE